MQPLLEHLHPANWGFLWDALSALALRLCAAFAILWFGWWFSRRVANWISRRGGGIDPTLRPIVRDTAVWGVRLIAVIGALSQIGIQTASIVAVLGAAGLAIGLALQGTLQNIAAGIMLLLLRPFKVGDFVTAGGVTGTVKELGIFGTTIISPDNVVNIVGNNKIFSDTISNYSATPLRRVELTAKIANGVDPVDAAGRLRAAIAKIPNVSQEPPPDVEILSFTPEGPLLAVRPYTNNDTYWQVYFDTNRTIVETFKDAGYPTPETPSLIRRVG